MSKTFNVNGICYPNEHYMVNIDSKLAQIKQLVDEKKYFVINRARQYGKTTTLNMLVKYLADKYTVFFISFEGLGETAFESETAFCGTICELLYDTVLYEEVPTIDDTVKQIIIDSIKKKAQDMLSLSSLISNICKNAEVPVILMIDEVDQASDHKVFIDFLGMLRSKFLKRSTRPTFQSVILAGVYDIKNLKHRIREDHEHQMNSPWNIAADFSVDMSFTRDDIATDSVDGEMLNDNIGYIRVTGFNTTSDNGEKSTFSEFKDKITELQSSGMSKMIIDLRDNPGGVLDEACNMADMILPEGIITYTETKSGKRTDYNSDAESLDIPIVILINENSASASEVFTGALKDYGKATVVGKKSYGKGIVQSVLPFYDGSGMSLTVAKYYTPNGTCIHGIGIEPDVEVDMPDEYKDMYASMVEHDKDTQLQKAIEIIKEK